MEVEVGAERRNWKQRLRREPTREVLLLRIFNRVGYLNERERESVAVGKLIWFSKFFADLVWGLEFENPK